MYTHPLQWAELYETLAGRAGNGRVQLAPLFLHVGRRRRGAGQDLATRAPSLVMGGWNEIGWMSPFQRRSTRTTFHSGRNPNLGA